MAQAASNTNDRAIDVSVASGDVSLAGELELPAGARAVVVFAHGSGSSRHSPRNRFVARTLRDAGLGTLLFDLLTAHEEALEARTRHLRFDIGLLTRRLLDAVAFLDARADLAPPSGRFALGLFGASTGAAAALAAAAALGERIGAVVSRGGRPDLAGDALPQVRAPTLLVVGGDDVPVIALNREALARMRCPRELAIVPGASHLFEEPGTLERAAQLAADWFAGHLAVQS